MKRSTTPGNGLVQAASSQIITTCATLAALILFVVLASVVLPQAFGSAKAPATNALSVALILNIAIILFGWRRSKDLREGMEALQRAETEAHLNAYTDHATGLANRRSLVKELEQRLAKGDDGGALILLDLDHFKKVNDLHGHAAGDALLMSVGARLAEVLPPDTCIARLGGDEFAALIANQAQADRAAESLLAAFAEPLAVGAFQATITISAGIAPLVAGLGPADVLHRADIAMYSAKRSGRNMACWFDSELEEELRTRVSLEQEIRRGIETDQFVPFFQPLVSLDTGELQGFEVLARWRSPTRGLVEPSDFLDVAESAGLLGTLSMRVMEKALAEARCWPAHLKIAVNFSPVQFRDPMLAQRILKTLADTGFPAQRLEVEITEGSLLGDPEQAAIIARSLKNSGITIALDDFGTGYASLSQLQTLPFDRIKIDRSFVGRLADDGQTEAIVKTIASLGKSLSVPITAEGVESDNVRRRMADMGCADAQGWLFGRAVSAQFIRAQFGFDESPPGSIEDHQDGPEPKDRRSAARRAGGQAGRASSNGKW